MDDIDFGFDDAVTHEEEVQNTAVGISVGKVMFVGERASQVYGLPPLAQKRVSARGQVYLFA